MWTTIGDGQDNLDLQFKVTVPQRTLKEYNTDETETRQVQINVKTHEVSINENLHFKWRREVSTVDPQRRECS